MGRSSTVDQAFFLRPDPARVLVRPFKPATEPRDLNATDKTRANHIVDRVLALDAEAVGAQLADIIDTFQGRHRNLLATFEARADEMAGGARMITRRLSEAVSASSSALISSTSIPSTSAALFNPSIVLPSRPDPAPNGRKALDTQPACCWRRPRLVLTFRTGTVRCDGAVERQIRPQRLASMPQHPVSRLGPEW